MLECIFFVTPLDRLPCSMIAVSCSCRKTRQIPCPTKSIKWKTWEGRAWAYHICVYAEVLIDMTSRSDQPSSETEDVSSPTVLKLAQCIIYS